MHKVILTLIISFISIGMNSQHLDRFLWQKRVIIVKSQEGLSTKNQALLSTFSTSADEMKERKIVLYQIISDDYTLIDYKYPDRKEVGNIPEGEIERLFNLQHPFEFLLVGLDGGIKLRQTEIPIKEDIFNLIDAMPMRKAEIHSTKKDRM